ncbi:MAG: ATP-dependent helicase [Patescibacteria group bacterium]|nr:ATP-dependent helicase [Patescibacteria group bacterium]
MKINPQQKQAIRHGKGPLLIVAGAGTGKTTVITERIRFLINDKKVKPKEILALAFTEKAAGEMLNRVDEVMPLGYEEPWLSTFHSFCQRILESEALEIGLDPSFKILSEPQQWLLIRKHLFEFDLKYYRPLGNPTKFISALLQLFSRAKDEVVSADDFLKYAQGQKTVNSKQLTENDNAEEEEKKKLLELANAYKKYQELLISENAMDFGDLLLWVIKLFKTRPSVLKKYQEQFKYILVDEFQDTNIAQFEIIKLLAPSGNNPNLVVVADDDQSIFKFRGAAISNVLEFKKEYQKAKIIALTQNYRSTQKILDSAYKLIQNNNPDRLENKLKINKHLISLDKKDGSLPLVLTNQTGEEEADAVAEQIINLVHSNKFSYADFAILARANSHLDAFVASLRRKGIPYSLVGNRGLFDQEEIRSLISFLRFLVNHEDNVSLYQLLLSPVFSFTPNEITRVLTESHKNKVSLWQIVNESEKTNKSASTLINMIKTLEEKVHSKTVTQILYEFLASTGFIKSLLTDETVENALKINNINLFFEKVKNFESQSDNPTVFEFVDYLELLIEAGENPAQAEIEDIDTVKLLTVHSAKGLEFTAVFIVNLVVDRFPSRERKEALPLPDDLVKENIPTGDYHLQEERRLFYVGLTRAKDFLFLTWAKNYGGVREKRPSGFLEEVITENPLSPRLQETSNQDFQLSLLTNTEEDILPSPKKLDLKPLSSSRISFSQLETYRTCPLKYYYKYVLHVTGIPNSALNFGQALHRTLRDFHKADLFSQNKSLDDLLRFYKNHFTEMGQGYASVEHRLERFKQGQEIMEKYYKKYQTLFGKPVFLEQRFTVKVGEILLIGAIDRIDQYEDRSFEVIDYKTGESEQKEKKIDKDEQLTIYALAAHEALGIDPKKYTLYFLENDVKATTQRNEEQIVKQKEEINKIVSEIKTNKFPAKIGIWCKWCEFNKICPAYRIGQNNF